MAVRRGAGCPSRLGCLALALRAEDPTTLSGWYGGLGLAERDLLAGCLGHFGDEVTAEQANEARRLRAAGWTGRRAPRMLPPYCPALYKNGLLMNEVLIGRRPLVRCRFSRYRCPLPGFEPSTVVECDVGPASSRRRLSYLPMKPSNGLGGSRGDVEDALKANVVGRHSQSGACGRRGCSLTSGRLAGEKNWNLARAKSVPLRFGNWWADVAAPGSKQPAQ
jgi:hypothetical protein